MAIAETPHSIGGGDEVLRISRERERLSWPHRDLRRVTPPRQHLVLVKHRDYQAGIDERTQYVRQ